MNARTDKELLQEELPKDPPASPAVTSVSKELKKYSGVAERILRLMIAGCKQEQAAKAVGVTPGYVSQLCAEEDFQVQLAQNIKIGLERSLTIDDTYDGIEETLVKKLKELIPLCVSLDQVMRILKFVNSAERKTQQGKPLEGSTGGTGTAGNVVKLILPVVIRQNFVVNPNNEVIAVDDRAMVTLNSESIITLANEHEQKALEQKVREMTKPVPKLTEVSSHGHERTSEEDKWGDL